MIKDEKFTERYGYLGRKSNESKTDEEFKEWKDLRKKLNLPIPTEKHRYSKQRALHDKYGATDN